MQYGTSFSHRHLEWLGLNPIEAFKEYNSLGFKWVRLSLYWNEIEKNKGRYDFSKIEPLLELCEKNKIDVVLSVGLKAPRFPEFYIPGWLENTAKIKTFQTIKKTHTLYKPTLRFIRASVKKLKKYPCLKVWQAENEPLDHCGLVNFARIDFGFLKDEIKIIKNLDPERKIMVNIWGNELTKRKVHKQAMQLADIVGLDIYLRHPIPFLKWLHKLIGPMDSQEKIKSVVEEIKSHGKEVWLAELQAEPWEQNEIVTCQENPQSFSPKDFARNINYGKSLLPEVIFFWGFEYWLWKKEQGDLRYYSEVKRLIL